MRTYHPERLPFFPTPYPGESLYSVLCRYHVRSGNATNRKTILQLFGAFASLCSTLLLPSMLNCFEYWAVPGSGIDAGYMFRDNTAYSLCVLRSFSDYIHFFPDSNLSAMSLRGAYRWPFRQCLIQHPSRRLRYCPVCAADQKKLYGESYWQVLPQLDGVEYCPIHHTRIATTVLRYRDLVYTFHPADVVIDNTSPAYPACNFTWYHCTQVEHFPELFVAMAKAIAHLWKNLPAYGGIWSLLDRYRTAFEKNNDSWQSTEHIRIKLYGQNPPPLVRWLLNKNTDPFERKFLYFNDFTLSEHAMMISMLSPSPQEFFSC